MKKLLSYLFFGHLRKGHELTDRQRRQILVTLYVGSFGYFYYSLKDQARNASDGEFTFRDVLRHYGCDGLADKLDAVEAKILGLPEPNLRPSDEELIAMFNRHETRTCTCASTTPNRHFVDCALMSVN